MKEASTITLVVSKVDELLFSGEAVSVTLPGSEGEFTILPRHEPFITLLKSGTITIRKRDGTQTIIIEKGLLETSYNTVTVLL